jgi:hypothetical protein
MDVCVPLDERATACFPALQPHTIGTFAHL